MPDPIAQAKAELPFFVNECLHFSLEATRARNGGRAEGSVAPLLALLERVGAARRALGEPEAAGKPAELDEVDARLAGVEKELRTALAALRDASGTPGQG